MWINVRPFTTASLLQILDGKCLFNFIKKIASPQFFLIHFGEKNNITEHACLCSVS